MDSQAELLRGGSRANRSLPTQQRISLRRHCWFLFGRAHVQPLGHRKTIAGTVVYPILLFEDKRIAATCATLASTPASACALDFLCAVAPRPARESGACRGTAATRTTASKYQPSATQRCSFRACCPPHQHFTALPCYGVLLSKPQPINCTMLVKQRTVKVYTIWTQTLLQETSAGLLPGYCRVMPGYFKHQPCVLENQPCYLACGCRVISNTNCNISKASRVICCVCRVIDVLLPCYAVLLSKPEPITSTMLVQQGLQYSVRYGHKNVCKKRQPGYIRVIAGLCRVISKTNHVIWKTSIALTPRPEAYQLVLVIPASHAPVAQKT